jgi:Flp pilus assembly protein TadG
MTSRIVRHPGTAGHPRRGLTHRTSGQAIVEFALVIILFLALIVLIFEGALLAGNWFALGNAAREGARAGSITTATDSQILDAVNRTASVFTRSFASVTANTSESGCTGTHTLCVCRHAAGSGTCTTSVTRGDQIDVTIRHRFYFIPFAGGYIGQNAGLQLVTYEQARIE